MCLRSCLANVWNQFQGEHSPAVAGEVDPLLENHVRLVLICVLVKVERFFAACQAVPRQPLMRAFSATSVRDLPTTCGLINKVKDDATLPRLCRWPREGSVPSEAAISRAFSESCKARIAKRMHEALAKDVLCGELIGHI